MAWLLEQDITPNLVNSLKKRGYKGEDLETMQDALNAAILLQGMVKGDTKAFNAIMDLLGEKQQKLEISSAESKFAEVLDLWSQKRDDSE